MRRSLDFISKALFPCCNLLKFRLPSLSFNSALQSPLLLTNVNRLAISKGRSFSTIQTHSVFNLRNTSSVFQNVNFKRHTSAKASDNTKINSLSVLYYVLSLAIFMIGVAYAGAPLYRIFCQVTGVTPLARLRRNKTEQQLLSMEPVPERHMRVIYESRTLDLNWRFTPLQKATYVRPGELVLAFFDVENLTDRPITGVATYSVFPEIAGPYLVKVQCFCFDEQRLLPHERVQMPVLFYLDPTLDEDPDMEIHRNIRLSYVFHETKTQQLADEAARAASSSPASASSHTAAAAALPKPT